MKDAPNSGRINSSWAWSSAALGGLAWLLLGLGFAAHRVPLDAIGLLFLLAPLVIVPLGFGLARSVNSSGRNSVFEGSAIVLQPFGAILAASSFWVTPGRIAAALAVPWFLVCGLAALTGLLWLLRGAYRSGSRLCVAAGFVYLSIGGVWLVLSRFGITPMHFAEPIILLTAVHFHFTGFALPMIAGATGLAIAGRGRISQLCFRGVVVGILTSPSILATGYVVSSEGLKMFAALLLAVSCFLLAALLFSALPRLHSRLAQLSLAVAALSLVSAMILAAAYAIGQYTDQYWLLIPQMARWHGTANALGFSLCGLLGWTLESSARPT
jgi:hypothetical protein